MFLRGMLEGKRIDNSTEKEISGWLELVRALYPRQVMIYTIDRKRPPESLKKCLWKS